MKNPRFLLTLLASNLILSTTYAELAPPAPKAGPLGQPAETLQVINNNAEATTLQPAATSESNEVPTIKIANFEPNPAISQSLFIITSHTATLAVIKGNEFILTLQNVEPYITKFKSNPNKKTDLVSTTDLIQTWLKDKNSIALSGTPIAALAGIPLGKVKTRDFQFQLSHPVYDAKHATMTFHAKWVGTSPFPSQAITFINVSLFVDDGINVAATQYLYDHYGAVKYKNKTYAVS